MLLVLWKCFVFFVLNIFASIILWSIFNFVCWFLSKINFSHKLVFPIEQFNGILLDEPIVSYSEDLFNRGKFISDFYEQIAYLMSETSFVFSLYGGRGEGKTSVLNLLKQKFEGIMSFLLIDFNPWYFNDKEAILRAFYSQLERGLSKDFILRNDFSRTVRKYLQYISFGANFGFNLRLNNTNKSIEIMKQNIGSYLETMNIKILVFVDDIDRLQLDEVLQVFSIIKNSADLKNIIFVLSFDPTIIERLLQKGLNSGKDFLDKIVQMPVNLPKIPSEDIGNYLIDNINKLLQEINLSDYKKKNFYKEFLPNYREYCSKLFRTLRHIKRYINGIRATLPSIKREVNLHDFFILEIICNFFPLSYDDIWNNRRFYIQVGIEEDLSYFFLKDEEIKSAVKEHVDSILKEAVGEDKERIEILRSLLKILFPVRIKNAYENGVTDYKPYMNTFRIEQRITHQECFDKYFTMKASPSEISDEAIEEMIDLWKSLKEDQREQSIKSIFLTFHETKKLKEFFKKLRIFIDIIDENLAVHIINTIYSNVDKFSKEVTKDLWNSEYGQALFILLWLVNDKIDKEKIQSLLEDVVKLTPSIPFAVDVVRLYKKESGGSLYNIYESIKFGKLADLISRRLKKHFIDGKIDIFSELPEERGWEFVLYQWASRWTTFRGKNKDAVSNYIISLTRDDAKKFVTFLTHQMRKAQNGTMTFDINEFRQTYSIEKIASLAEKFKGNTALSDEEKKVLEQFLKLYRKIPPTSKKKPQ